MLRRVVPKSLKSKLPNDIKIVEISKKESKRLNLIYRNKNRASNVLSFTYNQDYGEILVCPEIVRQEAKKQGNSYKYQMTWMILHGMIHLAGIHHEKLRRLAKRVGRLESLILEKLVGKNAKFKVQKSK